MWAPEPKELAAAALRARATPAGRSCSGGVGVQEDVHGMGGHARLPVPGLPQQAPGLRQEAGASSGGAGPTAAP